MIEGAALVVGIIAPLVVAFFGICTDAEHNEPNTQSFALGGLAFAIAASWAAIIAAVLT